jgi:hypothetical protein
MKPDKASGSLLFEAKKKQKALRPAANTPSGLKLPSLAANRSQVEKSFFGSFFSKKEPLPAT